MAAPGAARFTDVNTPQVNHYSAVFWRCRQELADR